ncbi:MAG: hypothetical protein ABEI98_10045, partial [Halorhabdus sp.]
DRLVVWNPEDAPVTYQFSAWDWADEPLGGDHESARGIVPPFAAFDVSDPTVEAEIRLDYDDIVTITTESAAPDKPAH